MAKLTGKQVAANFHRASRIIWDTLRDGPRQYPSGTGILPCSIDEIAAALASYAEVCEEQLGGDGELTRNPSSGAKQRERGVRTEARHAWSGSPHGFATWQAESERRQAKTDMSLFDGRHKEFHKERHAEALRRASSIRPKLPNPVELVQFSLHEVNDKTGRPGKAVWKGSKRDFLKDNPELRGEVDHLAVGSGTYLGGGASMRFYIKRLPDSVANPDGSTPLKAEVSAIGKYCKSVDPSLKGSNLAIGQECHRADPQYFDELLMRLRANDL